MDKPHGQTANHATPATPGEAQLRAAMEQSDLDVAAGSIASLEDVLAELDGVANEIEARRRVRSA